MTTTTSPDTHPGTARRIFSWLWNPFTYTAGMPALITGLVILLVTSAIGALSNTHFDGVLDTHTGRPAPLWFFLAEGIVNWLSLAAVLWIAALLVTPRGQKFRAVDLLGTQALARWPFLLVAVVCLMPGYTSYTRALTESLMSMQSGKFELPVAPVQDMLTFWGAIGVMLVCIVWFVALAWKSFQVSCDVKGWQAIVAFIVGIFIAEVISKIVIVICAGLI